VQKLHSRSSCRVVPYEDITYGKCSTEELLIQTYSGDAMTEAAKEELSQIPLISWLAATTNIPTPQHS